MISAEDIDKIHSYLNYMGNDIPKDSIFHWLRTWETNKQYLFEHLFKGSFTMTKEIKYSDDMDKLSQIRQFEELSMEYNGLWNNIINYLPDTNIYSKDIFVPSYIADNYFPVDVQKVKAGTKIYRAFTKLIEELPAEDLRDTLSEQLNNLTKQQSIALQNINKTSSKVTLSIHPLDFLTLSNNNCGWRSCVCLSKDKPGDYSLGTVEMMNSPYAIVAYIENTTKEYHPTDEEWTWNNKQWRELFLVHPKFVCGIKGYPYEHVSLEQAILDWIAAEIDYPYDTSAFCYENDFPYDFSTNFMYNDLECNEFIGYLSNEPHPYDTIDYGAEVYCPRCGEAMHSNSEDTKRLVCAKCRGAGYCNSCGRASDILIYIASEEQHICEDCYDENYVWCASCQEDFHYESASTLYHKSYGVVNICCNCLSNYTPFIDEDFTFLQDTPEEVLAEIF